MGLWMGVVLNTSNSVGYCSHVLLLWGGQDMNIMSADGSNIVLDARWRWCGQWCESRWKRELGVSVQAGGIGNAI